MRDIAIPKERAADHRGALTTTSVVALPLAVFAVSVVIWQLLLEAFKVQPFVMPHPTTIWSSFVAQPAVFLQYGWNTTKEALAGLVISSVIGIAVAAFSFRRPALVGAVRAYGATLMALPVIAVVPLANVFFGFTPDARIFVVVVATTPIVAVYAIGGLASTDVGLVECYRSCAASPARTMWSLYFPSSLPALMSGLRVAVPTTFAVAIIAEFFGGQINTLGTFIKSAALQTQVAQLWGASLMAFLIAIVLFGTVVLADNLLVVRRRR